ncbi:MAG: hypothetical protein ACYTHJ_08565 [Planctomycetota bacterium]|jgi:hypothetical protein
MLMMVLSVLLVTPGVSVAQDLELKGEPIAPIRSFLQLPPNLTKRSYFEITGPNGDTGFSDVVLKSVPDPKELARYEYRHEMGFLTNDGARIEVKINADLSTSFMPRSVTTTRQITTGDGSIRDVSIETSPANKKITIRNSVDKENPVREIPQGDAAFVVGLDAAVEMIDYRNNRAFMIREFFPQSGNIETYFVSVNGNDKDGYGLSVAAPGKSAAYQIKLAGDGKVLEWFNVDTGVTVKRIDKARMDKLRARVAG